MLRNYFWTIIVLATILSDCGKDDFKPDFSKGKAAAIKNGQAWEGQGRGTVNNQNIGFNMYYDVFNEAGELRQRLGFSKIPKRPGTYAIYNTSGQSTDSILGGDFVTISHDGDVVEDRYRVLEGLDKSSIIVLSYDESKRLFKGQFHATFYLDPARPKINPNNPDTIRFEQGIFEVTIEE